MRWDIVLVRNTRNKLNPDITQRKLKSLAKLAEQNRSLRFFSRVQKFHEPQQIVDPSTNEEAYKYEVKIRLEQSDEVEQETAHGQFQFVLGVIQKQAASDGWVIANQPVATSVIPNINGNGSGTITVGMGYGEDVAPRPPIELPKLTAGTIQQHFRGVFERDAHIRVIHDSMMTYQSTNAERRSHVLLWGKPASCKTTLFERFKGFYEQKEGVERVAFVDGPTMSKAGLENWMMQMAASNKLPEVVCIEEIEKQNMDNLLTLLSVMGSGYIMKTNARIGRLKQLARCVIWATCNDEQLLKSFRNGALWSRFTHKLHCRRPGRELMEKILLREAAERGGDKRWVSKAIEFAYETMRKKVGEPMEDPREMLGLLDGGNRLLDNSYQRDLLTILGSEKDDTTERASA